MTNVILSASAHQQSSSAICRPVKGCHRGRHTALDESYTTYFLNQLNDYPPDLVFSIDETCWRLFEAPRKVLAEKGAEVVKLLTPTDEKTSFTAIGRRGEITSMGAREGKNSVMRAEIRG
jgi:hypothetical protein